MDSKRLALQPGLVVFAKNKKRVSAFYQQTLGLAIEPKKRSSVAVDAR